MICGRSSDPQTSGSLFEAIIDYRSSSCESGCDSWGETGQAVALLERTDRRAGQQTRDAASIGGGNMEEVIPLSMIKKGLLALLALVFLLMVIDQVRLAWEFHRPLKEDGADRSRDKNILEPVLHDPLSTYLATISEEKLFGLNSHSDLGVVKKLSIDELVKDIRLRGIVFFNFPEAIVEDARSGKTSFVRKEQKIGELNVKEVKKDSLLLSYEGEEKELRIEDRIEENEG